MRLRFAQAALPVVSVITLAGCSILNAPGDVSPGGEGGGTGGSGAATAVTSTTITTNSGGGPTTTTTSTTGGGGTGGCESNDACVGVLDLEPCQIAVCDAGTCVAATSPAGSPCGSGDASDCDRPDSCDASGVCQPNFADAGLPCGSETSDDCTLPDTCDGAGTCAPNDAEVGTRCAGQPDACSVPVCVDGGVCGRGSRGEAALCATCTGGSGYGSCGCEAGACAACSTFASLTTFDVADPLQGWSLSGGWNIYKSAPPSQQSPGVPFASTVFGTDGNRVPPYPSAVELETSTATSPPLQLTNVLAFKSWNVDEGYDSKALRLIFTDTGEVVTLFHCDLGMFPAPPNANLCQGFFGTRAADAWDSIAFDTSAYAGRTASLEFSYNTHDACCGFEQGWFIDDLNFGCGCDQDSDCADLGSACGTPSCDLTTNRCVVAPLKNPGEACGSSAGSPCTQPDACTSSGLCARNDAPDHVSCDSGNGHPSECVRGVCYDCLVDYKMTFDAPPSPNGWSLGPGWSTYSFAPPLMPDGSDFIQFASSVFGNDGYRVPPYPGTEVPAAYLYTSFFISPPTLEFDSWHVDHGIEHSILVSSDGGGSYTELVNCASGMNAAQPFCAEVLTRAADQWDHVSIDMAAYAGQSIQLAIGYIAPTAGQGNERGWFLDNLNWGFSSCQ